MATDYNNVKKQTPVIQDPEKPKVKAIELPEPKKSIFKRIANAIIDPSGVQEIKGDLKEDLKTKSADAIKSIASSALKGAVDSIFYGQSTMSQNYRSGQTNYSGYSYGSRGRTVSRNQPQTRSRQRFNSRRFLIETAEQAETVLSSLTVQVHDFGSASVADFYNLVDVMTEYTDNSYGWRNLDTAHIERVAEGYIVVLPEARML